MVILKSLKLTFVDVPRSRDILFKNSRSRYWSKTHTQVLSTPNSMCPSSVTVNGKVNPRKGCSRSCKAITWSPSGDLLRWPWPCSLPVLSTIVHFMYARTLLKVITVTGWRLYGLFVRKEVTGKQWTTCWYRERERTKGGIMLAMHAKRRNAVKSLKLLGKKLYG